MPRTDGPVHVRLKTGLACLCALAGLAAAVDAAASPLFDLTGGTDGLGGLQAGTVEGGASAAYFNPALLVDLPFGLSLGVLALSEQIGVALDGRPGVQYAVPDGIANATHASGAALGNVPIPTNLLQNGRAADRLNPALAARPRQGDGSGHQTIVYETIGFVAKLLDDRVALGFYGIIPDGDFTNLNAFYPDEREQYFSNSLHPELYADRLTSVSLAFGGGWKVSDALSIGVGASLSLRAVRRRAHVRGERRCSAEPAHRHERERQRERVPQPGHLVQAFVAVAILGDGARAGEGGPRHRLHVLAPERRAAGIQLLARLRLHAVAVRGRRVVRHRAGGPRDADRGGDRRVREVVGLRRPARRDGRSPRTAGSTR